jgi:hypothetical protein
MAAALLGGRSSAQYKEAPPRRGQVEGGGRNSIRVAAKVELEISEKFDVFHECCGKATGRLGNSGLREFFVLPEHCNFPDR